MSIGTCGIDEVGRGALAGPVVVGAVTLAELPADFCVKLIERASLRRLVDSKRLTRQQRERVFTVLQPYPLWAIGQVSASEVDRIGLTRALRQAAGQAITALREQGHPLSHVQADAGLFHPFEGELSTQRTVKGDETIPEITLASIMAKVVRDRIMLGVDGQYPLYGFAQHVGYGTAFHRRAIQEYGVTPEHRQSFLRNLFLQPT